VNQNSPIIRKVVYLSAIAVLMLPLYWLGQPASYSEDRTPEGGGQLALLRMENQLSQAELGEIDPTSESMKLATLGLRGPAANFLWNKAMKYQRRKNWDALSATVQQIIRLQPNFLGVWEFQSHNLTYNVSVDFDDYRHRYTWVKKGIDFLCIGNRYNHDEPRLLHYTGWFIGQKIGIADEHVEFRELFRNDQDYHDVLRKAMRDFEHDMDSQDASGRHDRKPDNWLVGRLWYLQAVRAVDSLGKSIRKKSPLVFHADPAKSRMNYADAIEDEGHFGEVAQNAWARAGKEWEVYADHPIPTSWGMTIKLNLADENRRRINEIQEHLESLVPGVKDRIIKRRKEDLSERELAIWNTPEDKQNEFSAEDWYTRHLVGQKLSVSHTQLASQAPESKRDDVEQIVRRLNRKLQLSRRVRSYRQIVNFDYWRTRCIVEQTMEAAKAREHGYKGMKHFDEAELELAREQFEESWKMWLQVIARFPQLKSGDTRDELLKQMQSYKMTLTHLGEEQPSFVDPLEWLDSTGPIDTKNPPSDMILNAGESTDEPASSGADDDDPPPVEPKK